jgi:hypothetical protein
MTHTIRMLLGVALVGCSGVEQPTNPGNDEEVITTVSLRFVPGGGGDVVDVSHADPENDGNPVIDPIVLTANTSYSVSVKFLNELETPAEDITEEVSDERDDHQVFFYGSSLQGPGALITHFYDDADTNGLPLGLANAIEVVGAGAGELKLMLRHMPRENNVAVKVAGLAEVLLSDGAAGLPGAADVDVTFPISVE